MGETDHRYSSTTSMLLVGGGVLASRCLGLIRDCIFAAVWGTGLGLAAFLTAWTVPNLLRSLFGEGAFSAAFVPAFSSHLEREGRASAWDLATRTISVLATLVVAAAALVVLAALFLREVASGELSRQVLTFLPWIAPYAVFICLSAALAGILNSLHRFALPAFSQLLLNAAFIVAALLAWHGLPDSGLPSAWYLVAAVLAAGALQFALLLFACRRHGGRIRFTPAFRDSGVRRVFALMGPAVLGAGVMQINVLVDRALACSLGSLAVNTLYFSQRLVYLPVGLFAVAATTVSLPSMSKAWARGEHEQMLSTLRHALRQTVFLSLPAFVMLVVLHEETVRVLFQRGNFTAGDALATSWTMLFYLPGIPAFIAAKIVIAPFHAQQDTRTPVKIAVLCLSLNVVLNLLLMRVLAQGGLALATTLSSWLNVVLLLVALRRKNGHLGLRKMAPHVGGLLLAACVSGLVCVLVAQRVSLLVDDAWPGRVLAVAAPALAGGVVYLATCLLLKCPEALETLHPLTSRLWSRAGAQTCAEPKDKVE